MLLPSPSAIRHARASLQRGLEEFAPATVTIDGVVVSVSGIMGALHKPLEPGGNRFVQVFTFTVSKTALPTAPPINTTLTTDAKTFTIREVEGEGAHHTAWRVIATRTVIPGEA